jgi:hypothetical protein
VHALHHIDATRAVARKTSGEGGREAGKKKQEAAAKWQNMILAKAKRLLLGAVACYYNPSPSIH